MDVTIIALTGLPSSGKGEFSIISKSYGYEEVIMGDIIRNEIVSRNLEVNRLNSNKIMIDLRNTFGKDIIAKRTLDIIITKIIDEYYGEVQKMGGQRWDTSSLIKRFRK